MARIPDPTLRATILNAARTIFKQKGFSDARISDIASEAGVAVGTIYLYFKTKEALAIGLAEELNKRILNESIPLLTEGSFAAAIDLSARKTLEICRIDRDLILMVHLQMSMADISEPCATDIELMQTLVAILESRIQRGEAKSYNPAILATMIIGLMERAALTHFLSDESELPLLEETLVKFLQNALVAE
ncbi:MAG: TetR/AcrR family transcriptional regulator [Caldilineaceae bacterium]